MTSRRTKDTDMKDSEVVKGEGRACGKQKGQRRNKGQKGQMSRRPLDHRPCCSQRMCNTSVEKHSVGGWFLQNPTSTLNNCQNI